MATITVNPWHFSLFRGLLTVVVMGATYAYLRHKDMIEKFPTATLVLSGIGVVVGTLILFWFYTLFRPKLPAVLK